ncbi:hypothetical protein PQ459_10155 [Chryseobacterium sp. KACC 21268]|nr:hypothetical protein PQ459_10155 [Chryseobacterium sp. KACC 21268]
MTKIENDLLEGLEKGNDLPIVVSPFGFKEQSFEGKKYLVPMTQNEYINCIKESTEISDEDKDIILDYVNKNSYPSCYMQTDMYCYSVGGCRWCRYVNSSGVRFCYCLPQ